MLRWYYCVAAVYGLLLAGRVAALMGPAAAACYLVQVAFGVGPVPAEVAVLRAAVLTALGVNMFAAGCSYRFERDRAESGRVAAEATGRDLEHAATHDGLTGLPNRGLFLRELTAMVASRSLGEVAVVVLDVACPVTELKIDRSFVAELGQDATLRRLGADAAQGYHIARPMPDTELASWASPARRPAHT